MRDLQECKAEVFRRSEKRIKEKKRHRRYALAVCVPVLLCVAVLSVYYYPEMKPTDINAEAVTTNPVNEMYTTMEGSHTAIELFAGSVSISGNGISLSYTSEETVEGIAQMLDQILLDAEKSDEDTLKDFATSESVSSGVNQSGKEREYKILVKRGDDTVAEYLLMGPVLRNQTTQEQIRMSGDALTELKDALGIPQD